MIGAKGRLIREISEECGGIIIRFPNENLQSDKVYLRGPKEEVDKAKKRLREGVSDRVSDKLRSLLKPLNLLIFLKLYILMQKN